MATIVENGTAPDECFPQIKKFKIKPILNTIAGYNVAVYIKKENNKSTEKKTSFQQYLLKQLFVSNLNL